MECRWRRAGAGRVDAAQTARFDGNRVCFTSVQGKILVGGAVGEKLMPHCTLLTFDPQQLNDNPAIAFAGGLDFVTLDHTGDYEMDGEAAL